MMRGTGVVLLLMLVACFVTAQGKSIQDGPGNGCPSIPEGQFGICVQGCGPERPCPPNSICCSNGCGTQCQEAEGPGNGYPPIPPVQVGICVQECSHVISCPPDYICRSTGCGTVCRDDDD
ncbi:WAP four-disulfide core domain protein 18-like isoform X2 [Oratosquilla oratoria]|uniref:WAP four-disulfide core domain protein 18-like isoform X2 n=1 Tax=Oratosquilla oratoria TaxID=337810 RepID=UPI003F762CA8